MLAYKNRAEVFLQEVILQKVELTLSCKNRFEVILHKVIYSRFKEKCHMSTLDFFLAWPELG